MKPLTGAGAAAFLTLPGWNPSGASLLKEASAVCGYTLEYLPLQASTILSRETLLPLMRDLKSSPEVTSPRYIALGKSSSFSDSTIIEP